MDELLTSLRAAGEATRLRLLALCAQGEWTVSELVQILGQSQPRVSRHLKLLCDAGLLDRRPEGSWVFYRARRDGRTGALGRALLDLLPATDPLVARDRERLAAVRAARDEQAAAFFRELAATWDEARALHLDDAAVEAEMLRLLPPHEIGDLLDIGTATGRVLELFGRHGVRGVGIDRSREMLAMARAKLAHAGLATCWVQHADMYALPWHDPAFDAVTIHHVLHFADRPQAAIAEAARVVRPGGRLLIADFAPHDVEALRRDHAHRFLGFEDAQMRGWLAEAGLAAEPAVVLPGSRLTVCLWRAGRPGAEHRGSA